MRTENPKSGKKTGKVKNRANLRQFTKKLETLEKKLGDLVLETSRSHLKDLQTFFDETTNMKNLLNSLFQKVENMSTEVETNQTQIAQIETNSETLATRASKLESSLSELDQEIQK